MPGQPKTRAAIKKIEGLGGIDWFIERIAGGDTVRSMSKELKFSEHIIYKWLHQDPERSGLVKAARKIAAERLADEALDLADNVEADTVAICEGAESRSASGSGAQRRLILALGRRISRRWRSR